MPEPRIHRGIDRRSFLARLAAGAGLLALGACDRLSRAPTMRDILGGAESLTMRAQRFLLGDDSLATEYTEADLSPAFRANGTTQPAEADQEPRDVRVRDAIERLVLEEGHEVDP